MNRVFTAVALSFACATLATAQGGVAAPKAAPSAQEQELLTLSRTKWRWMADKRVDSLSALFHDQSMFVHMSGSMTRAQELETIRTGRIHYKHAEIFDASVRLVDSTAIVLSRIRLDAVVGGNEVTNPFMVTEVYLRRGGKWVLGQLSFSRLAQ